MTDATKLTPEEIQEYREQFRDYPEALAALTAIEECEGNLQYAVTLIKMRETGTEPDRQLDLDELSKRCRSLVCANLTKNLLDIVSIVTSVLGTIGVALAVLLYILKEYGLEKFCQQTE